MIAYIDTSAALRIITRNPDPRFANISEITQQFLDGLVERGDILVSSALLRTEMLCQANRQDDIDVGDIQDLVGAINLAELESSDLDDAPSTPGRLRTLDAIHLTVALRTGAGIMVAWDEELRRAAQGVGMRVGPDHP